MPSSERNRRTTVVILAGGKGTRLKPFTVVLPKPLVPLGDMAVLEVLLRRLSRLGFHDVVISTGHLAELIMAVAGDGSRFGLEVRYSHEEKALGTAGPLALIEDHSDTIIVMNGDLLTTLNFSKMIQFHDAENADVTIGIYRRNVKIDFGVVETADSGDFIGFTEKPTYEMNVSMGVNILSRQALARISCGQNMDMPDLILNVRDSGGKVSCFSDECYWLDIGRVDDYAIAQESFEEHRKAFLGEVD